ncbi:MAG: response regulator [Alteromonadaceae bacterium]|nr:MAG: response regulator [Alteromonadaceae bacterium]
MLTPQELKVVVSTLGQRRVWLRKSLEDNKVPASQRKEHIDSLKLLDTAMQKLANTGQKKAQNKASPPAPAKTEKGIALEKARILIAEDDEDSAKLLIDILQDFGIKTVDLAEDGKQAFDKIKTASMPYHIILCDWDMPELTGLEVHSKAKASNTLRNAHFIMVTAVSEASRIKQAVMQGVNDYIVKPIDIDILENKIKAALKIAQN